jgi:hypothetical protein
MTHRPAFRLRFLLFALLLVGFAAVAATSCNSDVPSESQWMSHVRALADDALEGRETAHPGYRMAADYVARELKRFGVESAWDTGSYFQRIPFLARRVLESECAIALRRGRRVVPLTLGEDAVLSMRPDHAASVDARLVFVGYGLHIPELGYSDLEGQNLRGAIAVYVQGTPEAVRGTRAAHASALSERWKALRAAGAVGIIRIPNPSRQEYAWSRVASRRFEPALVLDGREFEEVPGMKISLYWNSNRADRLFQRARFSFASIRRLASASRRLPRFELPYRLQASVASAVDPTECRNVIGVVRGADKKLRDEVVVLSAHLDHLGISAAADGDSIYNGAMDNASGCATLLEVARELRRSGHAPKRTVLFLFTTGEESGLFGATYFVARPTVPAKKIVADLNIDMFLPIQPIRGITAYGIDESDLGDDVRRVAKLESLRVVPDRAPQRNYFVRSDQYSFVRRGIPAVMLEAGPVDSAGRAAEETWNRTRYHDPSDDASQEIDLGAVARYNRYVLALTRQVADRSTPPRWRSKSAFRRFASGR